MSFSNRRSSKVASLLSDPRDRYDLIAKIGEGGYGYVCQAFDTLEHAPVAIKIVNLEETDDADSVHREISIMSNVHCPQLISYFNSYVVENRLWIVMEFLEAGSLLDIIKDHGPIPERFIPYIMQQLLLALQYLHANLKIHRDVKAGNLLVGRDGRVKLADFGVTGQLTDQADKRQTKIGTPFWMAPEVITQSLYNGCADIWSTGITAIELAKGLPPFASKVHPMQVIFLIPKSPPPTLEGDEFSATFKSFVATCLVKDPQARLPASALLQHEFVRHASSSGDWVEFIQHTVVASKIAASMSQEFTQIQCGSADSGTQWSFTSPSACNTLTGKATAAERTPSAAAIAAAAAAPLSARTKEPLLLARSTSPLHRAPSPGVPPSAILASPIPAHSLVDAEFVPTAPTAPARAPSPKYPVPLMQRSTSNVDGCRLSTPSRRGIGEDPRFEAFFQPDPHNVADDQSAPPPEVSLEISGPPQVQEMDRSSEAAEAVHTEDHTRPPGDQGSVVGAADHGRKAKHRSSGSSALKALEHYKTQTKLLRKENEQLRALTSSFLTAINILTNQTGEGHFLGRHMASLTHLDERASASAGTSATATVLGAAAVAGVAHERQVPPEAKLLKKLSSKFSFLSTRGHGGGGSADHTNSSVFDMDDSDVQSVLSISSSESDSESGAGSDGGEGEDEAEGGARLRRHGPGAGSSHSNQSSQHSLFKAHHLLPMQHAAGGAYDAKAELYVLNSAGTYDEDDGSVSSQDTADNNLYNFKPKKYAPNRGAPAVAPLEDLREERENAKGLPPPPGHLDPGPSEAAAGSVDGKKGHKRSESFVPSPPPAPIASAPSGSSIAPVGGLMVGLPAIVTSNPAPSTSCRRPSSSAPSPRYFFPEEEDDGAGVPPAPSAPPAPPAPPAQTAQRAGSSKATPSLATTIYPGGEPSLASLAHARAASKELDERSADAGARRRNRYAGQYNYYLHYLFDTASAHLLSAPAPTAPAQAPTLISVPGLASVPAPSHMAENSPTAPASSPKPLDSGIAAAVAVAAAAASGAYVDIAHPALQELKRRIVAGEYTESKGDRQQLEDLWLLLSIALSALNTFEVSRPRPAGSGTDAGKRSALVDLVSLIAAHTVEEVQGAADEALPPDKLLQPSTVL